MAYPSFRNAHSVARISPSPRKSAIRLRGNSFTTPFVALDPVDDITPSHIQAHIQEAVANERKRIARDIHDDIGHRLTVSLYHLDRTLVDISSQDPEYADIAILRRMLGDCLDSVRSIPWNLHNGWAEEPDLAHAIKLMLSEIPDSEFMLIEIGASGSTEMLPPRVSEAAIRITQEAVTNILKYAKASIIRVLVNRMDYEFVLDIEDNGIGFSEGATHSQGGGHGLIGMRQRAVAAGGTLYIHSLPGSGTRVRFVAPIGQGS